MPVVRKKKVRPKPAKKKASKRSHAQSRPTTSRYEELPDTLKPYAFHGLDFSYKQGTGEASSDCPFCGRDGKFSISAEAGLWRCFVCGGGQDKGGGNWLSFLQALLDASDESTKSKDYSRLANERGLEYPDTLVQWGAAKSILTDNWLIPAWDIDPTGKMKLRQLYNYQTQGDKKILLPTPQLGHCLFGVNLLEKDKSNVMLCEGPWDGMRLWEVMKTLKDHNGNLVPTASSERCLLANVNILAAPGCNSFPESARKYFKGKDVTLLFDNDHPRLVNNREAPPAGHEGMKRVARRIGGVAGDITHLRWGPDGYDPDKPNGYDVRDILSRDKAEGMFYLLTRIKEVPGEWRLSTEEGGEVLPKPCKDWKTLVNAWRKAMKWTSGLDHGLAVMLACVASTKRQGDQLWIKVIGPPSSGKSTLCEAISVNKKHILAKSTIRGFHSGYKTGSDASEDNSMIPLIKDKTLVTKDGDTLLQTPNVTQILSEARDLYDSVARTHYRNKMGKDYENIRMTWVLCGTSSLRAIDSSELGARFLDCVIMDGGFFLTQEGRDLEDDILWRAANRAAEHVNVEADGTASSHHSPEYVRCMELTGGYVNWLREESDEVVPTIQFSEEALRYCTDVGKFVAYMRARPSKYQGENAERELAARLVSQHVRLAKMLALVLNRPSIDNLVLHRVRRVGLDTARGLVLDLCGAIYHKALETGMSFNGLQLYVNCKRNELQAFIRFLKAIGVLREVKVGKNRMFQLTDDIVRLFDKVLIRNP